MNRLNEEAQQERRKPDAPGGKHSTPDRSGAATGTGPAQPWDKKGRKPDQVEDEAQKASGVRKSGDRKPDQDSEDELEDALEQTFPASDPVSAEQIVKPGKPPRRDR